VVEDAEAGVEAANSKKVHWKAKDLSQIALAQILA
jgi:hypothetical protein